jgi:hypothetical protein
MDTLLPVSGLAIVGFCLWLTVRIINRQERWAKKTAIVLAAVTVGYPLSFGPAYTLVDRGVLPLSILKAGVYSPCFDLAFWGPEPARRLAWAWAEFCGGEFPLAEELVRELGEQRPDLMIFPSPDFVTDRMPE